MRKIIPCLALCLCSLSAFSPATAATSLVIQVYDRKGTQGSLAFSVDGGEPCRFKLEGKDQTREVCTLSLPPEARTITLQGDFSWLDGRKRKKAKGTQRWQIVDLAPLTSPLRDTAKPFGQRLHDFLAAKTALEQKQKALAEEAVVHVELGKPASSGAVKAAEKRLGFSLPPEYVSLLLKAGALNIQDSSTTGAEELKRSYDYMIKDWETPRESMEEDLSPQTAALLKETALLFTEVGDGLGALLYQPKATACGGQPAYYWIHQDGIDEPRILKNRDGKCKTFTESMLWVVGWLGLAGYDGTSLDVLPVDRSSSGPWRLDLWHADNFQFQLRFNWEVFE